MKLEWLILRRFANNFQFLIFISRLNSYISRLFLEK